jgi:hypothetical protein
VAGSAFVYGGGFGRRGEALPLVVPHEFAFGRRGEALPLVVPHEFAYGGQ